MRSAKLIVLYTVINYCVYLFTLLKGYTFLKIKSVVETNILGNFYKKYI